MNKIKELRKTKFIKQWELCKTLGVSQGTLSAWETGRWEPDIRSLLKLCEIFDCSVDYLLGRSTVVDTCTHLHWDENRAILYLRGNKKYDLYVLTDSQAQAISTILEGLKNARKN